MTKKARIANPDQQGKIARTVLRGRKLPGPTSLIDRAKILLVS
jgi:hypothetical protein